MANSLYIHIPFCRRKCTYCDFYSAIYDAELAERYVDVLLRQLQAFEKPFSTIYIGGGTPTALDRRLIDKLLSGLGRLIGAGCEFTVEANPESVDQDKLRALLSAGVNRISIGVQSLRDDKLKRLGRVHDSRKALEAITLAGRAGFQNVSIDIIFGVWQETLVSWKKEARQAAELPVKHISCYGLTYEKETPLWGAVMSGSVKPIDDGEAADMYECAIDTLGVAGFRRYEISNFAADGYMSRHNLNYWENNEYSGLGASAVSYLSGSREKNVSDIGEYIDRAASGLSTAFSKEKLSPVKRAKETAAVKIRTAMGIDFGWFRQKTGFDFMELEKGAVKKVLAQDLAKIIVKEGVPSGICLKRKGFLFCDSVSSELL